MLNLVGVCDLMGSVPAPLCFDQLRCLEKVCTLVLGLRDRPIEVGSVTNRLGLANIYNHGDHKKSSYSSNTGIIYNIVSATI